MVGEFHTACGWWAFSSQPRSVWIPNGFITWDVCPFLREDTAVRQGQPLLGPAQNTFLAGRGDARDIGEDPEEPGESGLLPEAQQTPPQLLPVLFSYSAEEVQKLKEINKKESRRLNLRRHLR